MMTTITNNYEHKNDDVEDNNDEDNDDKNHIVTRQDGGESI